MAAYNDVLPYLQQAICLKNPDMWEAKDWVSAPVRQCPGTLVAAWAASTQQACYWHAFPSIIFSKSSTM